MGRQQVRGGSARYYPHALLDRRGGPFSADQGRVAATVKQWHNSPNPSVHHFTSTGVPTPTPSIILALSPTIASSKWPLEPNRAISVISG